MNNPRSDADQCSGANLRARASVFHELSTDELEDILDDARHFSTMGQKKEADAILNSLADSIKKSLVFLNPKLDGRIPEIIVSNETLYSKGWSVTVLTPAVYPLSEGIEALRSLYGAMENTHYSFLVHKQTENSVMAFFGIVSQILHDKKMKEVAPLVEEGRKRKAQLTAPREKKNKVLLKHCIELMKAKPSSSAETLFRRIPKKEKAEIVDGFTFYRDDPDDKGEEKIYCVDATGMVERTVGSRPFFNYYKEAARKLVR
jgi:hypothetical protein